MDLGAFVIGSWEARQIASNNSNLWFTAQAWKNLEKAQPEGYYLVGYPTSYNKTTNMGKVGNKVKKVFEAAVVCLPIEKIDYGELTENQKGRWKEKDSFFGRIVDMENVEAPEDIRGMSGGLIFSIERDGTGMFR